jgi:hypothetical protein
MKTQKETTGQAQTQRADAPKQTKLPEKQADTIMQQLREAYKDAPDFAKKALEEMRDEFSTLPETRMESAGRVGHRQGEVSEFTLIFPLAKGGAERLRRLLGVLHGNFQAADKVGSVHDMRFVFLDNDTKLLFATAYDGDWDPYIDDFATKIPNQLDVLFAGVEGWPGIRSPQVKDFLAKHQVSAEAWYVANPNLTVAQIARLDHVGKAVEQFLDKVAG